MHLCRMWDYFVLTMTDLMRLENVCLLTIYQIISHSQIKQENKICVNGYCLALSRPELIVCIRKQKSVPL